MLLDPSQNVSVHNIADNRGGYAARFSISTPSHPTEVRLDPRPQCNFIKNTAPALNIYPFMHSDGIGTLSRFCLF